METASLAPLLITDATAEIIRLILNTSPPQLSAARADNQNRKPNKNQAVKMAGSAAGRETKRNRLNYGRF